VAGGWLAISLRHRVGPSSLAGVAPTGAASTAAAVLAAGAGYTAARALPGVGVAGSVGITVSVAAISVAVFLVVVGRFDPTTVRLLLRRGRAGDHSSPTGG
jgi:hypothetical protein